METEENKQLSFFDIFISNVDNYLTITIFHTSTNTGSLLNYTSFTSRIFLTGLIK